MPKETVLVIGGAGYIGAHVIKDLLKSGYKVRVFDDLSTGKPENLLPQAEFIKGNILDEDSLKAALTGKINAVIHLAAKKAVGESMENPQKYAVNNITGTINILNAMADCGVKKIIFSSSAAVYGIPAGNNPVSETSPLNPINFYGFTKLEIERLLAWYDKLKGIKFVALRYFNAVGYAADGTLRGMETDPQNLFPIIMEVANGSRTALNVFGNDYATPDGTCVRDYIHVEDLAAAHTLALKYLSSSQEDSSSNRSSRILNLGTGRGISVQEAIEATARVTGRSIPYNFASRRVGDPAVLLADASLAEEVLNWHPTCSGLDNIIATMWSIYKNWRPRRDSNARPQD